MPFHHDVIVIGGGAAGIAAARRLHDAQVRCLLVEARDRLGGRAFTVTDTAGHALDLGCGWLHSAERNPWSRVAEAQGLKLDKSPPPWTKPPLDRRFPPDDQKEFQQAIVAFFARLEQAALGDTDVAATVALDPSCRWNGLINSIGSYISGMDLQRLSAKDFEAYADDGVNWRVKEGYGTVIAGYGAHLPVLFDCEVNAINHSNKRLRLETNRGSLTADQAIVTVPSTVLAAERIAFTPALPAKIDAARGLPLGLADKLFMTLDGADEFDADTRVFGRIDRNGTGAYHVRPLGRPLIEAYYGGSLAAELEAGGDNAFFVFAREELTGVFGSSFASRIKPLRIHAWGRDPFALGSYSSALPGFADCRAVLAEPVDDRLFFAGEACSRHDFSTAHGGFLTGVEAAEAVIKARLEG